MKYRRKEKASTCIASYNFLVTCTNYPEVLLNYFLDPAVVWWLWCLADIKDASVILRWRQSARGPRPQTQAHIIELVELQVVNISKALHNGVPHNHTVTLAHETTGIIFIHYFQMLFVFLCACSDICW